MMLFKPKIGLAFSGGGGRGAYQIGVWNALHELNLDSCITAVAGTSVGALNALLFAQNDLQQAEDLWINLTPAQILSSKIEPFKPVDSGETNYMDKALNNQVIKKFVKSISFFSRSGLSEILETTVTPERMKRTLFVCASNIGAELSATKTVEIAYAFLKRKKAGIPEYFCCNHLSKDTVKKYLLASSAIPVVFSPVIYNENVYYDGGLTAHVPIEPLYNMNLRQIIIVNLFPSIFPPIEAYPGVGLTYITPHSDLGSDLSSSLDFTGETAKNLIATGYTESMPILKKLCKHLKLPI